MLIRKPELTLPQILKIKEDNIFKRLSVSEQKNILVFVNRNNLNVYFYDKKGFDILKQCFFAYRFVPNNEFLHPVSTKRVDFATFDSYFKELREEIYINACYYGYTFSKTEIQKYGLNPSKLYKKKWFDSRTIDSLKFIDKTAKRPSKTAIKRVEKLIEFEKNLPDNIDLKIALDSFCLFTKNFHFEDAPFLLLDLYELKYGKSRLISFLSEFLVQSNLARFLRMHRILLRYGESIGKNVFESLKNLSSLSKKALNFYNDAIISFAHGQVQKKRREFGYNTQLNLFEVRDNYNLDGVIFNDTHLFIHFDDFKKFCNNDLKRCDLINAPISKSDILDCEIDEKTKLPFNGGYSTTVVQKRYIDDRFEIVKHWLDIKGSVIQKSSLSSEFFCDFVHYANNDLSSADLLMCDGIENISKLKEIKIDNIKVRTCVAQALGLELNAPKFEIEELESFDATKENELATVGEFKIKRIKDDEFNYSLSYVTDIHLEHRFIANKCKTENDVEYVLKKIVGNIDKEGCPYILIGGDISSNTIFYKRFIDLLEKTNHEYFITLGNHELWNHPSKTLDEIVAEYKEILSRKNIHFLYNNLFIYKNCEGLSEIDEKEIFRMTEDEIYNQARESNFIIFGGLGFAGLNNVFNAQNGIYRDAISREQEIELSSKFYELYKKVKKPIRNKNVVILTHMPFTDWSDEKEYVPGFVYVSGHNHRNYLNDSGNIRVYSDNQIGYLQKEVHLKTVSFNNEYDYFDLYDNGIYQITRKEYLMFYRGINERIDFNRDFKSIFMIKKHGIYMFLAKNNKGALFILNGGAIKKVQISDLEYYYANLETYSKSMALFLEKYLGYQKRISQIVKDFGGHGYIHGSIVDIDFLNHLYINPIDGSITPYRAYSMVDKFVFKNLISLITYSCPELLDSFKKMLLMMPGKDKDELTLFEDSNISEKAIYVDDTKMYKISRVIKSLQYNSNFKIVRMWDDSIIEEPNEETGKQIVASLIEWKN